jgi:hypothetical protein
MSYATTNHTQPSLARPNHGRTGKAYRAAVAAVRAKVERGAPCHFWRKTGHEACPGRINLTLHHNHRLAFTAHHLRRLMDGGAPVVNPDQMAPAHRSCNARDGLMAQNQRRAKGGGVPASKGRGGAHQPTQGGGKAAGGTGRGRVPTQAGFDERVSNSW